MTESLSLRATCGACAAAIDTDHQGSESKVFRPNSFRSSATDRLTLGLCECPSCGLIQTSLLPDAHLVKMAYAEAHDEVHSSQFSHRVESFRRALVKSVLPYIEREKQSPWLDIGTAGGAFVDAARHLSIEAIGIEPSEFIVENAPRHLASFVHVGDVSTLSTDQSFSVISYWDVLEHVVDPRTEILNAINHLKPGGFLVLNLPMIDTPSARILRGLWPFYLNVHLYYFTLKTVTAFLESLSLKVVSISSYSQTLSANYLIGRYSRTLSHLPLLDRWRVTYRMGQRTIVAKYIERS